MNKRLILAALAALVLLSACAPKAGTAVQTKDGAVGCQIWVPPDQVWKDCKQVGNLSGVVEDHPQYGHADAGRIRVRLEGKRGVYWFEEGDLIVAPEK